MRDFRPKDHPAAVPHQASPKRYRGQAQFRVTRTGSTSRQLDVPVRVETSISSRVRTKTLRLEAGSSTSGTGFFAAQEDAVICAEFTITWTIQEGEG